MSLPPIMEDLGDGEGDELFRDLQEEEEEELQFDDPEEGKERIEDDEEEKREEEEGGDCEVQVVTRSGPRANRSTLGGGQLLLTLQYMTSPVMRRQTSSD